MLIRQAILERITRGEVTLAFRRWIRPTVKAGGTLRTSHGVLAIVAVEQVDEGDILDADARRAGHGSRAELLLELERGRPGWLYRIELRPAGPDPRVALRERRVGSAAERELLAQALARLDGASRTGPWTRRVLEELRSHPGVLAATLARRMQLDTATFKRRVRRLKELGLTESLERGYRLSPRGLDALGWRRRRPAGAFVLRARPEPGQAGPEKKKSPSPSPGWFGRRPSPHLRLLPKARPMKTPFLLTCAAFVVSSCAMLGSSTHEIVYVAEASGGAWSAASKARAAMESLEGVTELHMSGARAVFQIEKGETLKKEVIAKAFEEQGMKLESFERVERPRAAVRYEVDSGVTWAVTAAKVREALIEKTGALDVYFEDTIEILMPDEVPLREEAVRAVLTESKVEFSRIEKSSSG